MPEGTAAKAQPSFFRNVAMLLTGNLLARVCGLALFPILTRLFTPEALGAFAAVESVLMVLTSVCHLRYPMAILLPQEERDVDGLMLASLAAILGFSLLLQAATPLAAEPLAKALNIAPHAWLLHWVPAAVFLSGLGLALTQYSLRAKAFRGLAAARVGNTAGERGLAVILGFLAQTGVGALLVAKFAGLALQNAILAVAAGPRRLGALFSAGSRERMVPMASRYRRFALFSFSDLVLTGALQLPVLILAMAFSPAAAGFFALCRRVLREPLNLLGQSLYRAYSERAAEYLREGRPLGAFTERFMRLMIDLSLVPLLLVALGGEELFVFVFGAEWARAGAFATLLCGFYAVNFMGMPLGSLFDLQERQKERTGFDLCFLAASAAGLLAGAALEDDAWAVGLFALLCAGVLLVRLRYLHGLAGVDDSRWWRGVALRTLRSLPLALPLAAVKAWYPEPLAVFLATGFGAAAHLALVAATDETLRAKVAARLGKTGPGGSKTP
jgi:O-antigen/teichoic acid export membrane protein